MNISLEGKIAVVCGSTQGIGKAIALSFAESGATCFLVSRNEESLKSVLAELAVSHGQKHRYFIADFSDVSTVEAAVKAIAKTADINILVNNTGGPKPGPITDAKAEDFTNTFSQHIVCNQVLVQGFLPGMKKKGQGRIINIISTSTKIPIANLGVSNTIRAAVASWAKTLSNEIGQFDITVNNILPGYTETERLNSLIKNISSNSGASVEAVTDKLKNEIPMKRFGTAEELASLATFLASAGASYITGTSIAVDGGKTGAL
ncbi:MAG: SDR family oxidoreductase [Chitinophagaceae bacterium]|nr:MAG: SDR family oxidoreductase [Chitinophagaceae bacterium]